MGRARKGKAAGTGTGTGRGMGTAISAGTPAGTTSGSSTAGGPHTEVTAAVVIGCGLSGLAVASELSRQGVEAIVLNGLAHDTESAHSAVRDTGSLPERAELLRLLHGYAAGHSLDIRAGTAAQGLGLLSGSGVPVPVPGTTKWAIHTHEGVLLADAVVLTGCGKRALLGLVRSLGFSAGADLRNALRNAGLYVVGAGEALACPTRELARSAKRAAEEIAVRNSALSGYAALRTGTA
ncbi:FAD-binding protein [Arthrobacter sp. NPDC097144]|uniref:FAD-binding protein n=1 Tax=Arthrobacter sp. NPDC097144 TaxID=3363946 RepID=UPI0037FBA135